MEDLKDSTEPKPQAATPEDPDLWDWARTAGVSREELRVAVVEQSRGPVN